VAIQDHDYWIVLIGEPQLMRRYWVFLFFSLSFNTPTVLAQVIECPGALPGAQLKKEQTLKMAERLLGRFSAALGLHGLSTIDETAIIERYRERPEQLLTKLTYLTLQCQMVLLDSTMSQEARSQAVRRVFLDYVLQGPDMAVDSLAAYVNKVATTGRVDEARDIEFEVARVEQALLQSARSQWAEMWFLEAPKRIIGKPPQRWSVIIASPRFEDDGWQTLRRFQASHPDIHFELDGPFDLDSPHYAIVAGRGLTQDKANRLLARVKEKGLPDDSYVWRAPAAPPVNGARS
jgi:hypothetical protein